MQPVSTCLPAVRASNSLVVLIADGASEVRAELGEWLEQMGHSVIAMPCGNDAIRIVKQQRIDVVITEVIMANGDGLELILELKRRQPTAHVVAISGGGRYLPAADCLRVAKGLGARETLMKPVQRTELLTALDRLTGAAVATRE